MAIYESNKLQIVNEVSFLYSECMSKGVKHCLLVCRIFCKQACCIIIKCKTLSFFPYPTNKWFSGSNLESLGPKALKMSFDPFCAGRLTMLHNAFISQSLSVRASAAYLFLGLWTGFMCWCGRCLVYILWLQEHHGRGWILHVCPILCSTHCNEVVEENMYPATAKIVNFIVRRCVW